MTYLDNQWLIARLYHVGENVLGIWMFPAQLTNGLISVSYEIIGVISYRRALQVTNELARGFRGDFSSKDTFFICLHNMESIGVDRVFNPQNHFCPEPCNLNVLKLRSKMVVYSTTCLFFLRNTERIYCWCMMKCLSHNFTKWYFLSFMRKVTASLHHYN